MPAALSAPTAGPAAFAAAAPGRSLPDAVEPAFAGWHSADGNEVHMAARRGLLFRPPGDSLSPCARTLYLILSFFSIRCPANPDAYVWPSVAHLSAISGRDRRTIQRGFAELREGGWVRMVKRGGRKGDGARVASTYELRLPTRGRVPPQLLRDAPDEARATSCRRTRGSLSPDPRHPAAPTPEGKAELNGGCAPVVAEPAAPPRLVEEVAGRIAAILPFPLTPKPSSWIGEALAREPDASDADLIAGAEALAALKGDHPRRRVGAIDYSLEVQRAYRRRVANRVPPPPVPPPVAGMASRKLDFNPVPESYDDPETNAMLSRLRRGVSRDPARLARPRAACVAPVA